MKGSIAAQVLCGNVSSTAKQALQNSGSLVDNPPNDGEGDSRQQQQMGLTLPCFLLLAPEIPTEYLNMLK